MTKEQTLKVSSDTEIRILPTEALEPDPANPNEMKDEDFELLGESLDEDGMVDVLQAVPLEDGKYRIVGGEHRWRQAKRKGWPEVPVMVLLGEKWQNEDYRRSTMVKLNILHGDMSPRKFFDLWMDMSGRWKEENLGRMMGFAKEEKLQKLIGEYRKKLKDAGVSGEQMAEFDKKSKKAKTTDDLRNIINTITENNEKHGRRKWMVMSIEGQEHLYVECDNRLWKTLTEIGDAVQAKGIEMPEVFYQALQDWKKLPCLK